MTNIEAHLDLSDKKPTGPSLAKGEDERMIDYDPANSEFMSPLANPKYR